MFCAGYEIDAGRDGAQITVEKTDNFVMMTICMASGGILVATLHGFSSEHLLCCLGLELQFVLSYTFRPSLLVFNVHVHHPQPSAPDRA